MNIPPHPGPVPADVQAQILMHLNEALKLYAPYRVALTGEQRKELGRSSMGRESIPFALDARRLATDFASILPRSVKDEEIAEFVQKLDIVTSSQDIKDKGLAIVEIAHNMGLLSSTNVMDFGRLLYGFGQDDNGRTPGVAPVVGRMGERYDRPSRSDDDNEDDNADDAPQA